MVTLWFHLNKKLKIIMSTIELEAGKSEFVREFLNETNEDLVSELICTVQGYSKEIVLLASFLREKNMFSFWDSHIVASALTANCQYLISEDMQGNQVIDGMILKNIFK
jgi:predicted nucleic acid-binding protein